MRLLERTAKLFGMVSVKQRGNIVHVSGLDGTIVGSHIAQIWKTKYFNKYMFSQITDTSLTLPAFFVPDFLYMLSMIKVSHDIPWYAKRYIIKIIDGIEKNTWWKHTLLDHPSIIDEKRLNLLKWSPLVKQREFLDLYGERLPKYDLRGYLLAAAPGTGKTFAALMVATCLIKPSVAEVKIIISPKKALHLVWEKSVRDVFKKAPTYWTSDSPGVCPYHGVEYYIFHYEKLAEANKLADYLESQKRTFFVVVDESHNFADDKSNRTKSLVELQTKKKDSYFLWLSGSPILKSAAELTSFLACSDKWFDADAARRFKKIFSASPGAAAEVFRHRLGQQMAFSVPKSEVSKSKPTIKELPIRLPPNKAHPFLMSTVREDMKAFIAERLKFYEPKMKEYRAYVQKWLDHHEKRLRTKEDKRRFQEYLRCIKLISRNMDKMMIDEMAFAKKYERQHLMPDIPLHERKIFRAKLSAIKNIKLKVRGEALGTVLSKRRSDCAAMLAVHCKPEKIIKESKSKTLFFASSVRPMKLLAESLRSKGFKPALVYGGTNTDLTRIMHAFENDPDVNPVCATMQSLSEAVPVTAASTIVLANRPFRQATWDQVVARADRIGQIHEVTVYELTLDTGNVPNVSSTTDDILAMVRDEISALIGPEFSGPELDERDIEKAIDLSLESDEAMKQQEELELI